MAEADIGSVALRRGFRAFNRKMKLKFLNDE